MSEEIGSIMMCPECRKVYAGTGMSLGDPCPNCGVVKWNCVLDPTCIIDAFEDQKALELIIDNPDTDVIEAVERLMGYEGGGCKAVRKDGSRAAALAAYDKALGCERNEGYCSGSECKHCDHEAAA